MTLLFLLLITGCLGSFEGNINEKSLIKDEGNINEEKADKEEGVDSKDITWFKSKLKSHDIEIEENWEIKRLLFPAIDSGDIEAVKWIINGLKKELKEDEEEYKERLTGGLHKAILSNKLTIADNLIEEGVGICEEENNINIALAVSIDSKNKETMSWVINRLRKEIEDDEKYGKVLTKGLYIAL